MKSVSAERAPGAVGLVPVDDFAGNNGPAKDRRLRAPYDGAASLLAVNVRIALRSEWPLFKTSDHSSPTVATRSAILRTLKVCGATLPFATSSHVHGADTGAPGFGRTV